MEVENMVLFPLRVLQYLWALYGWCFFVCKGRHTLKKIPLWIDTLNHPHQLYWIILVGFLWWFQGLCNVPCDHVYTWLPRRWEPQPWRGGGQQLLREALDPASAVTDNFVSLQQRPSTVTTKTCIWQDELLQLGNFRLLRYVCQVEGRVLCSSIFFSLLRVFLIKKRSHQPYVTQLDRGLGKFSFSFLHHNFFPIFQ